MSCPVALLAVLVACVEPAPEPAPSPATSWGDRLAPNADVAVAKTDPCTPATNAATCERAGRGACGWIQGPAFAGCVSLFPLVLGDPAQVGDEPLLEVGERLVLLGELVEAPLSNTERALASEHRASIERSFSEASEVEHHSSTYCGHGTKTTTCLALLSSWYVDYEGSENEYCGSTHCHYHFYRHSSPLCGSVHRTKRICGTWH